jgi:hypothetical protein
LRALYAERRRFIGADSAALTLICDGRTAIAFGNPANLSGMGCGPNCFRIVRGQMSQLRVGKIEYRMTSPTNCTAAPDMPTTSPRTVG